jgi:Zn-dependent peptidase ImmA (M78 family)/DNA-binding XRE family transcriptional regulator
MFTASRLSLARRRRALTKKQLAELVGVQPRTITALEAGEWLPADETVDRLSDVLDFPVSWFLADELDEPSVESVSFRAMKKMTAGKRDAAIGAGAIAFELNTWVEERFELPTAELPDLRGQAPHAAAGIMRRIWGIAERPIKNMVHLLEAKGIRVFSLAEDTVEVDAFSAWRGRTPFVFLNTLKTAEHGRFDAAHELGHLVLHQHGAPSGQDAEREANAFASSFLMPEASIRAVAPRHATISNLIQLKQHWTVSAAALAYRLHHLRIISDWHYRSLCIELGERGYRKGEPGGAQRETSQLWDQMFTALRADGMGKDQLAAELHVPATEIEKLVFGLVLMGLSPTDRPLALSARRAELRLIE